MNFARINKTITEIYATVTTSQQILIFFDTIDNSGEN